MNSPTHATSTRPWLSSSNYTKCGSSSKQTQLHVLAVCLNSANKFSKWSAPTFTWRQRTISSCLATSETIAAKWSNAKRNTMSLSWCFNSRIRPCKPKGTKRSLCTQPRRVGPISALKAKYAIICLIRRTSYTTRTRSYKIFSHSVCKRSIPWTKLIKTWGTREI